LPRHDTNKILITQLMKKLATIHLFCKTRNCRYFTVWRWKTIKPSKCRQRMYPLAKHYCTGSFPPMSWWRTNCHNQWCSCSTYEI
jgi:hypothetical protein